MTVTKTVIVSAGHTALAARTALPFARSFAAKMSGVMNGAKGGHGGPDGRTDDAETRTESESFTFFALCLAVALFTVLQVRSSVARRPPRRHSSFHGIIRSQAVSSPSSTPHVVAARFVWQRQVRGDNRIRHRYTTNRGAEAAAEDAGHARSTT